MTLIGHIQNGVVVLDGEMKFPEGARVAVTLASKSTEPQPEKRRVDFPLVRTGTPGTWNLTNEQIAAILEEEDIEAMKGMWNVPS
jgi:hypothetical protein